MAACTERGIPSVLYIKPFLPGITVRSKDAFVALANRAHISHAVIGPFYVDRHILSKIVSVLPRNWLDNYFQAGAFPVGGVSPDAGQDNSELAELEAFLKASGISVTHHGTEMSRLLSKEKRNALRNRTIT
jgi:hypothetical protein